MTTIKIDSDVAAFGANLAREMLEGNLGNPHVAKCRATKDSRGFIAAARKALTADAEADNRLNQQLLGLYQALSQ